MIERSRIERAAKITQKVREKLTDLTAQAVAQGGHFWNTQDDASKLIALFKSQTKSDYYNQQNARCCYCSTTLTPHKATYDLEHVIAKSNHPKFMFELRNLAAACKPCNGAKDDGEVLSGQGSQKVEGCFPAGSQDYEIVHPHFDAWGDYFSFDQFNRVVPRDAKASYTFQLCQMQRVNIARLADYFGGRDREAAENYLKAFFAQEDPAKKQRYIDFLETIVKDGALEKARPLLDVLKSEMAKEE